MAHLSACKRATVFCVEEARGAREQALRTRARSLHTHTPRSLLAIRCLLSSTTRQAQRQKGAQGSGERAPDLCAASAVPGEQHSWPEGDERPPPRCRRRRRRSVAASSSAADAFAPPRCRSPGTVAGLCVGCVCVCAVHSLQGLAVQRPGCTAATGAPRAAALRVAGLAAAARVLCAWQDGGGTQGPHTRRRPQARKEMHDTTST